MEVRSQPASTRNTGTAPQPSLRPEVRKRVAQSDLRLHSDCGPPVASRSVNLFLPKRPRGACVVVLSNAGCKVGRRIRQRGFLVGLVQSQFRVRRSSQAPFRCSDWPRARRSALPILESKMVECLGSETSLAAHSVRKPAGQTVMTFIRDLQKFENSMDFHSPSLVSCLAHVTGLFARTSSSKSQHQLWPVCLWNPVEATQQIDCWTL